MKMLMVMVEMRNCLGDFPRDKVATYNSPLSACPNSASSDMDACMSACAALYAHA
jgi:hypothetical protein